MISLTVWYSHAQEEGDVVSTPAELDGVLGAITALSVPTCAAVAEITFTVDEDDTGPTLYAGFCADRGVLWLGEHGNDHALYTLDEANPDETSIRHMYMEDVFEFPVNAHLPAALIRQAVHEFAETGKRPTCVAWRKWEAPRTPGSS
ncbi:Imm1 family immunity protein [Actinokineospora sp. G85]|uniref:Imm1 family immunity protein n=1 Tax=Actinokineospora sp. G85 TaxID=3406626 RepID=UPI003C7676B1